ncbi:unnamed protein product [Scytosiphon promiscuus]
MHRPPYNCLLITSTLFVPAASGSPVSAGCASKRGVAGSDVVLLMGQSNMSGRGRDYDADTDGPNHPRIQQWSRANTIVTASEHLEHADFGVVSETSVGMGAAFGRSLLETLPEDRNILLVPTAYGGTALVNGPWSVGGHLFEDAVTRMEAALASNEATGNCVAAVLWHQGEADANVGIDQETYRSTWTDMISTLRSRIPEAEEAPVLLGEFTPEWVSNNVATTAPILAAIRAIPDSVPFTAVAPSDGLSVNAGDVIHFDGVSQRDYGRRYFDKLGEAIENNHAQLS